MLLEFTTSNYKSFKNELVFSLVPAQKQKGLDYSVLKEKAKNKTYKGLCSSVIYGPNAAGKTNIIGAMDTFRCIVLRGDIRNNKDITSPNVASSKLELIPNNFAEEDTPVTFSIKFIEENRLIFYSFGAYLGKFLDTKFARSIQYEKLLVNDSLVFSRNGDLEFGDFNEIQDLLVNAFTQNQESAITLAKNNLNPEELFLMNGFKNMFSSKLVSLIANWLQKKFIVVHSSNGIYTVGKFGHKKMVTLVNDLQPPTEAAMYAENTLNEAVKRFGVNSNALVFVQKGESEETELCSYVEDSGRASLIPAEIFESYGTIRFVNLFPMLATALLNGSTLVMDEFDASIHPMALMNIVNIFHNDEINIHHAQLIFNTHNPIFLNANLFRRDEIKFVERDEEQISSHYSLSDFGTAGKSGVRKGTEYMKNYFMDRYGAIMDIDFSSVFAQLINQTQEE